MLQAGTIIHQPPYYILQQVVSTEICELLADYALFKEKLKPNVTKNIDPLDNVHREYGDPLLELLLEKLTPKIEQTLGCALWPTLSFYYVYHQGTSLQPHSDRSSCQWVASLCIGADSEFKNREKSWPLILKNDNQPSEIHLQCGDILLFKGHETEHWRNKFTGQWFVSAIFAFVEQEGPYAFQKYDQRAALGKPHIGMFRWSFGCLKQKLLNIRGR
ncbi:MAG: alpha-ketoglutarate-dependent dioxygenase AlkB [Gammaproteobacteria bacterium]